MNSLSVSQALLSKLLPNVLKENNLSQKEGESMLICNRKSYECYYNERICCYEDSSVLTFGNGYIDIGKALRNI